MTIKTMRMLVMLGLVIVALMSTASAQQTAISLPTDASSEHGNTVVVPLMANNVTNLANFDVNITYDSLVVNVTGVSVNDSFGGSSANALCNLKNAGQGSVNLVSFNLGDGYTGDCHLVDITLEAVGTAGQTTELGIVINGAANPDNDPIDPYPEASNGTFMVGGEVVTTDDIVINEIMYDPDGDEKWYEWIELYNNDTESINIGGWVLNGTIGGSNTILSGTMNAGSYLLIAKNVTAFQDRYPDVICPVTKGNWSALANSGDTINISDSTSTLIDTVTYTDIVSANYTAERNATSGWEESLVDGGTPCAENSVLGELLPLTVTADPTGVPKDTTTNVIFNVTSDGSPVEGAIVTLLGCGVDTNGTTVADGTVTISVTATDAGTIAVTATKDGHDGATTGVVVTAYPTPSATISLPTDASSEHGNTVVVPLMANNVTNLANFDVNITYDSLVVNVTGVSVNDSFGGSSANALCNLKNAGQGSVNLVSFNLGDGYTGDCHPVDITLEAVGTAGQTTELGIVINGAANPDNDPIDPYPEASNGTFTVTGTMLPLSVAADLTSVLKDTATNVTFTVTSDGSPVEGAIVTLLGCGVDTNGTTVADGTVTISVTATDAGTIAVTATKAGYDGATTGVTVTTSGNGGNGGGDGTYPPGWGEGAPSPAATSAPEEAASPAPTKAPTVAPTKAPTKAPTVVATETTTTEMKTEGTPGFGAVLTVFAIAGLLVAAYLVMRRRE